jgi:methionyl-tRNA formyltransferase
VADVNEIKPVRSPGLSVILFTNLAPVYQLATAWAARHDHSLRLVVTTPGPKARRSTLFRDLIAVVPPEQDVLITTRMRRLATYLAPLSADLIVSASFPYRIPADVTGLPRLGAFNLHPAMLPRYRGPNGARSIYEGEPTLAATLHRIEPEFDAGPIIYQKTAPLPDDLSPENVFAALGAVAGEVWEEGLARAIAGEAGAPQNEADATYAALFSEDEKWLDWNRPKAVLQRQATALNMFGSEARAYLDDRPYRIERVDLLSDPRPPGSIGDVARHDGDIVDVIVADGMVRVRARPLTK